MEKTPKKKKWKLPAILIVLVAFIAVIGYLFVPQVMGNQDGDKEVITESTLKQIINVSELSTFTAIYNGIAEVMDKEAPDQIDYYVSYEATVTAGIDFDEVKIKIDDVEKTIRITIPPVYITDINVDIGSLDYMFQNKNSNAFSVSEEALKACEADAQNESEKQNAIFELASQNAQNILTALTRPIIEQLYPDYTLVIE